MFAFSAVWFALGWHFGWPGLWWLSGAYFSTGLSCNFLEVRYARRRRR